MLVSSKYSGDENSSLKFHKENGRSSKKESIHSIRSMGSDRCLGVTNLADNDYSITGLLANPIKSGFLLSFCQSEFNAENMIFLLEIDRFRDSVDDNKVWSSEISYRTIDQNIIDFDTLKRVETSFITIGGRENWPSTRIPFDQYVKHVKEIWDTYLSTSAPHQICIPAKVLSNTLLRMEYLHYYGPYVFDETTLDPIKTLKSDVLPRFLMSTHCNDLRQYLLDLYPLPTSDTLHLKLPSKVPTSEWNDIDITIDNLRDMKLYDIFHDRLVYTAFLDYSRTIYTSENVLFGRALSIYRCLWLHAEDTSTCPKEAKDMAWTIFRYFICPGASFEVGMNTRRRKTLMQSLASPTPDMFEILEKSAYKVLRDTYSQFSFKPIFQQLPQIIKTYKDELRAQEVLENNKRRMNISCIPYISRKSS